MPTATDHRHHSHVFDEGNPLAERNAQWAVALTGIMMVAEITSGWLFNSMALLADGWHMSSHALALGLSVAAYATARQLARHPRFAFGTWKIEVLQGLRKQIKGLRVSLKNSGTGAEVTSLRRTRSRLAKEVELEWERIESLTRQLCEAEICLEAHGLSRASLTTNQEISVSSRTSQLLASYRAHIKSEISEFKARESKLK